MALGLVAFASCDGYEEPNPDPQTNPAQSIMGTDDITVAAPSATATAVSLADYEAGQVPVLQVTRLENWPSQYTLTGVMEYSATEDFAQYQSIDMTYNADDMMFYVATDDWQTAFIEMNTYNPATKTNYVRFELYAEYESAKTRLGDVANAVFAQRAISITPMVTFIVENSYTIVGTTNVAMTPNNADNVYDPPVFAGAFDVPEGGFYWQIKSESGKVYGPANPANMSGTLVEGNGQGCITELGAHMITIDLQNMTYTVTSALANIYVYTVSTSSAANCYPLFTTDFITYQGFANINRDSYRLCSEIATQANMRWGMLTGDDGNGVPGSLELITDPTASPLGIPVATRGCYYVSANTSALTYSDNYCGMFSLIGGFNGTSWGEDVDFTPNSKNMVWTATFTVTDTEPFEFKIRTNNDWDGADLGAGSNPSNLGELWEHGSNLQWTYGAGTFTLTLDLTTYPASLTVTPAN